MDSARRLTRQGRGGTALLLAAALCAGCASGASSAAGNGRGGAAGTPASAKAAQPASPADECASAIAYWAGQALTPGADQGYDYQEMGLSADEYQILLAVTALARPVARKSGLPAARAFARREALPRCAAYVSSHPASPTAPGGGWPQ
ncbi:hypothetical protein KGA66_24615 [Actinocrinis puniceicyclus]|uniref:Lipoprotein n=1 Tax=Actinocrinis puniceicyclus TaxID=977794 RepID=A0A8J7WPR1_9ACTN|nr:hypothetical protein [Actinocrinis puniceicyclus]MBS2966251.1 hypothetical protein [Actinocrinis puniceicyclus]